MEFEQKTSKNGKIFEIPQNPGFLPPVQSFFNNFENGFTGEFSFQRYVF